MEFPSGRGVHGILLRFRRASGGVTQMTIPAAGVEKANAEKQKSEGAQPEKKSHLARLALGALGVVFGDISTSPIYAIRECFHGQYGIDASHANVMGILSLMFWALVMIVGFKYLAFVFRANNHGEGGVMALTALIRGQNGSSGKRRGISVITLGLFAACLLYGDGMITPAISVLSAVEGIGIITPVFTPYVIPITIAILLGLFLIQRQGTARLGGLFGPVILVWLGFLAVTGAVQLAHTPQVLSAVFPWYAIRFLIFNKLHGFVVLGAVFLVVTGTEALYADMGHFGTRPIRLTWFAIVFPALVLNYFGQGALLLANPEAARHPFYAMVPAWAMIPTVLLATLSTIIASQAVISGAFSMTRQAIQLGYLPRLNIRHTAATQIGQIYVAPVNWMLMLCTILLVAGFQSSSKLAAAYGVAVTSTMLITTMLFFCGGPRTVALAHGVGRAVGGHLFHGRCALFCGQHQQNSSWRLVPAGHRCGVFHADAHLGQGTPDPGGQAAQDHAAGTSIHCRPGQPSAKQNRRRRGLFNGKSKCRARGPGKERQAQQRYSQSDNIAAFSGGRCSAGS